MTKKSMVARIGRSCTKGGVFLLLPLITYGSGANSFNLTVTDNINMLSLKEPGVIFSLMPVYDFRDYFGIHYDGALSVINLLPENIIIENYLKLEKSIDFEDLGNRNIIAGKIYSFFPISFPIYQMFDFGLSDSLNYYITDRYLFAPNVKLKYRYFVSDSVTNYTETKIGTAVRIPLPYFFFAPYGAVGMRHFKQDALLSYSLLIDFFFPLTGDFSLGTYVKYDRIGESNDSSIITLEYADDPFFEYENLHQAKEIQIALHRLFKNSKISGFFLIYQKYFFPVYNQTRADNGFIINVNYTKMISRDLALSAEFESLNNHSSVDDFDYIKNSILLNIRLTF